MKTFFIYCFVIIKVLVTAQDQTSEEQSPYIADYFFQLVNGLKADDYVPGAIQCTVDFMGTERDFKSLIYYFSKENEIYRPTDLRSSYESAFFNITGSLVKNLP